MERLAEREAVLEAPSREREGQHGKCPILISVTHFAMKTIATDKINLIKSY
jgi:hypothetical protein